MVEALTAVWAQSEARDSDLLVFLAIANDYNHEHEAAWPTVDRLASMSRVSPRQVQYSLRRLVELGELAIDERAVALPNGRKSNRYRILLPIQTRRVMGAKSASDKKRQVQSAASTGAISDTAYKVDPLKEQPLKEQRPVGVSEYVNLKHPHKHPDQFFWCSAFFCVSQEQHFKFAQRALAAGADPGEIEWPTWYAERAQEWGEMDVQERDPHNKGPMFWLAVRVGEALS